MMAMQGSTTQQATPEKEKMYTPQKPKIEPKKKEEDEHEKECMFMKEVESCVQIQSLQKEIDSYKEMGIL